jgi:hypothetical protein
VVESSVLSQKVVGKVIGASFVIAVTTEIQNPHYISSFAKAETKSGSIAANLTTLNFEP